MTQIDSYLRHQTAQTHFGKMIYPLPSLLLTLSFQNLARCYIDKSA